MGLEAKIGCVTPMTEEDAVWLPQYLREIERLNMPFTVHFDRCGAEFRSIVCRHPLFVGSTFNDFGFYQEKFRAGPLEILTTAKFDVAVFMDMDETFEPAFRKKMDELCRESWRSARLYWYNVWENADTIRVDNPSNYHRMKAFRLNAGIDWTFKGITVDPYPSNERLGVAATNVVSFNWGLMTQELRQFHKQRWDNLYTKATGRNPYGYWNYLISQPATTAPKASVCSEKLEATYG